MMWNPGDQILQQSMWFGSLLSVRPLTVIQNDSDYLVLYTHPQSTWQDHEVDAKGTWTRWFRGPQAIGMC
jgi:hypothetical protein